MQSFFNYFFRIYGKCLLIVECTHSLIHVFFYYVFIFCNSGDSRAFKTRLYQFGSPNYLPKLMETVKKKSHLFKSQRMKSWLQLCLKIKTHNFTISLLFFLNIINTAFMLRLILFILSIFCFTFVSLYFFTFYFY